MPATAVQTALKRPPFADARKTCRELNREFPHSTFEPFATPSRRQMRTLRKGSLVNVLADDERFWVKIVRRIGTRGFLEGVVDNCTSGNGYYFGDHVLLHERNVYCISDFVSKD